MWFLLEGTCYTKFKTGLRSEIGQVFLKKIGVKSRKFRKNDDFFLEKLISRALETLFSRVKLCFLNSIFCIVSNKVEKNKARSDDLQFYKFLTWTCTLCQVPNSNYYFQDYFWKFEFSIPKFLQSDVFRRLLTSKQNYDIILIKNTVVQGKYEIERVWNNMDRALGRCAPELSNSIFFDKNFCEPNKMPSKLIFDLNWGWTFVRGLYFLILKSKVAIDIPPSLKSIIIPGSTDKPL